MLWLQRSRINWLKEGDMSTKYFQSKAVWRARKNKIRELVDDSGVAHSDKATMRKMANEYFQGMYTADPNLIHTPVLSLFDALITDDDNAKLCAPFSDEEIADALFQIGPLKAPGPDGFTGLFFKKCWGIVKHNLMRAIDRFDSLHTSNLHWLNSANVVLLPKKDAPGSPLDYRPISLMHSIAKILCKLLANRLAPELDSLVSLSQSAFIKKRCIQDNFLYVHNVIREAHTKKKPLIFLKLDIAKAFDSVGWGFLLETLSAFGFGRRWRNIVSVILSSASSRILLNGTPGPPFRHMCGIRQGDPLSPYLFLLCSEGLSSMLAHEEEVGGLEGIKVCRNAPSISHLLFADDSLLFFKASNAGAIEVNQVLEYYCQASGQRINNMKSSIYFSKGVPESVRDEIKTTLNVPNETLNEKYLGMPSDIGNNKNDSFKYMKDRLWSKVQGWIERTISTAGKEVLGKSH